MWLQLGRTGLSLSYYTGRSSRESDMMKEKNEIVQGVTGIKYIKFINSLSGVVTFWNLHLKLIWPSGVAQAESELCLKFVWQWKREGVWRGTTSEDPNLPWHDNDSLCFLMELSQHRGVEPSFISSVTQRESMQEPHPELEQNLAQKRVPLFLWSQPWKLFFQSQMRRWWAQLREE